MAGMMNRWSHIIRTATGSGRFFYSSFGLLRHTHTITVFLRRFFKSKRQKTNLPAICKLSQRERGSVFLIASWGGGKLFNKFHG